jgi:hypothetical protein
VHGLATLLIDGRLNSVAQITEDIDNAAALVEAAIERMRLSLADERVRRFRADQHPQ